MEFRPLFAVGLTAVLLAAGQARGRFEQGDPGLSFADILIVVSREGANTDGTWRLSNVSIDWSQPVPEPASLPLVLLGLCALAGGRRRARASGALHTR